MPDQHDTTLTTVAPTTDVEPSRHGIGGAARNIGAVLACTVCCVGPLLFVTLGMGTGVVSWFQPLRPVFTLLTIALLAVAFYVVYRWRAAPACVPEGAVVRVGHRSREKLVLWVATVAALLFMTFRWWSALLP